MSKGIVISSPSPTKGRLVVVKADDNEHEVGENTYLDFANNTGEQLNVNDAVKLTITGKTTCTVDEKYQASRGKLDVMMVDVPFKEKVSITLLEEDDCGAKIGSVVVFFVLFDENGQYPGNPPTQFGDTIELLLTSAESGVFVKVVE